MTPMSLVQISDSAAALRGQIAAGIPTADAAERMMRLQPAYADFWKRAAATMRAGNPLSDTLGDVWPSAAVAAVRAGEDSGTLDHVMAQVASTVLLQRRLRAYNARLIYPAAVAGAAFVICLVFMVTLVPSIVRQLAGAAGRAAEPDAVTKLALFMESALQAHWKLLGAAVILGAIALINWLRSPASRESISRALLSLPVAGDAMRQMLFGIWAEYMAMAYSAGLSTPECLRSTRNVLPASLQDGVVAMEIDLVVSHRSLDDAVNPDTLAVDDPRHAWPFYLPHAFIVGERTGRLDVELRRVAPELIAAGERQMDRALTGAYVVALTIAAFFTGTPLVLVYSQIFRAFGAVH